MEKEIRKQVNQLNRTEICINYTMEKPNILKRKPKLGFLELFQKSLIRPIMTIAAKTSQIPRILYRYIILIKPN